MTEKYEASGNVHQRIAIRFVAVDFVRCEIRRVTPRPPARRGHAPADFPGPGMVMEFKPDGRTVVIRHEAISNYMAAMTMPFKVKTPRARRTAKRR